VTSLLGQNPRLSRLRKPCHLSITGILLEEFASCSCWREPLQWAASKQLESVAMYATIDRSEDRSRVNGPSSVRKFMATVKLERWWKPKAANLLAILYSVMLITRLPFPRALFLLLFSVVTIIGIGSCGHVINDWCDIDADAAAGKTNLLAGMAQWKRCSLAAGLIAMAFLPWLVLPFDAVSVLLLLLEVALLLAYSIPPFRLKARRAWAVVADSGYAYALPALLAAHTFFLAGARADDRVFLAALFAWQFALGTRHFLNHLALDRSNDIMSGTPTLATQKGNRYIHGLIRGIVLPVEFLGFLAYLLILSDGRRFLIFVMAGLFSLSTSFHAFLVLSRRYPVLTCGFSKIPADRLYQDILPLVLLSSLVLTDWRFSLLLLGHIALFYLGSTGALDLRALAWPVMMLAHRSEAGAGSALGSSDGNAVAMRELNSGGCANTPKLAGRPSIAVININRAKYTETFVQELVPRLPYNVYYLYGGELPRYDDDQHHFLPNLQSLAQLLEAGLRLEANHFLKSSISSYLQTKRVQLILAEFGPVGVAMLPIARDLGIPLVVCFHGYDVFHKETVRQCAPGYAPLFREAAYLVCVSETMLDRLEQLGAPREKLVHLPAFVNLEQFPYSDHSVLPPRFLAVGRFAETKSPHLTILAFHRVAQMLPQATLTMIGKGGGGELFEACVILVKALGLEDRVDFKGVVSHEEVAMEMRRSRVLVQHSVTTPENGDMEGKPVAVMEAMASGLPVVATRHPGILELIDHEVTGLLVPEYDVEAMAAAMIRLAQDNHAAQRLGKTASAAIHGHPLISRHVEILDEVIARSIAGA
jgi:colanic acid/amylovoran biosynthesis glycosyltransferase